MYGNVIRGSDKRGSRDRRSKASEGREVSESDGIGNEECKKSKSRRS